MNTKTVSFRCIGNTIEKAEQICHENNIDLTSYIIASLLHAVHAKIRTGEITPPESMPWLKEIKRNTQNDHDAEE